MAFPVWQASQAGNTNGTSALTVSSGLLAGFQVGDLALAFVSVNQGDGNNPVADGCADMATSTATHGGWTLTRTVQWDTETLVAAYYAVITGAGDLGALFDFTSTNQRVAVAAIARVTGQHASTPVLASTNAASGLASASPSSGTMTPEADALVVGVGAWEGKKTGTPTSSPAFTERLEGVDPGSDSINKATLYVETYVSPDATLVASAPTISSATDWSQMVFAVKPAAGGGSTEQQSLARGIARGIGRGIAG